MFSLFLNRHSQEATCRWGLNTSEVRALERLRDPNALFQVYYDDVATSACGLKLLVYEVYEVFRYKCMWS